MIPKIIHYVWVGGAPKSALVLKCIESWKKFLPDYEIIEWNDEKLAIIDCKYVQQAYAEKKWAFVSDYLRLFALHKQGGFYFDSDLEITQSIEIFRDHDFVTGFELYKGKSYPITAFMGAEPVHPLIGKMLAEYDDLSFIDANGELDLTPNTKRISDLFKSENIVKPPYDASKKVSFGQNSCIYPSSVFCTPISGQENYSIHHFNGSWLPKVKRKKVLSLGTLFFYALKINYSVVGEFVLPIYGQERIVFSLVVRGYGLLIVRNGDRRQLERQ